MFFIPLEELDELEGFVTVIFDFGSFPEELSRRALKSWTDDVFYTSHDYLTSHSDQLNSSKSDPRRTCNENSRRKARNKWNKSKPSTRRVVIMFLNWFRQKFQLMTADWEMKSSKISRTKLRDCWMEEKCAPQLLSIDRQLFIYATTAGLRKNLFFSFHYKLR